MSDIDDCNNCKHGPRAPFALCSVHPDCNDDPRIKYQYWTPRKHDPAPDTAAMREADIKDDSYLWGNGRHQRVAGIWFRIVDNKIVDRDQYRHDLESRADALLRSDPGAKDNVHD